MFVGVLLGMEMASYIGCVACVLTLKWLSALSTLVVSEIGKLLLPWRL